MNIEKKHIYIGLGVLAVIGVGYYFLSKKNGSDASEKVAEVEEDEQESQSKEPSPAVKKKIQRLLKKKEGLKELIAQQQLQQQN